MTLNEFRFSMRNEAIAGSDSAVGVAGLASNTVGTFSGVVARAYSPLRPASTRSATVDVSFACPMYPPSSVDDDA